jgi:hypothetical protein
LYAKCSDEGPRSRGGAPLPVSVTGRAALVQFECASVVYAYRPRLCSVTSAVTLKVVPVKSNVGPLSLDTDEPGLRPTVRPPPGPSSSGTVTENSALADLFGVD